MSPIFRRSKTADPTVEERAANFWTWWSANRDVVAASMADGTMAALTADITIAVRSVDERLMWEVGKGTLARHVLAISSEGDLTLRALTDRIVALAPPVDAEWEYAASRQPDGPDSNVSLNVGDAAIAAAEMRYYGQPDPSTERVDVIAWHPAFAEMPETERTRVAFLLLDSLLGEDTVTRWLGTITAADASPDSTTTPKSLAAMVGRMATSATGEKYALAQAVSPGGTPLFISVNRALKQINHLQKATLLTVTLTVALPNANGFPDGDEGQALEATEDALIGALPSSVHVGRVTGGGHRAISWYVDDTVAATAVETANAVLASRGVQGSVVSVADPTWDALKRGLLPIS